MDFSLQVQHVGAITVADISGEFDIYSAPRFKEMFVAHLDRGDRSFVINLEGVVYVDSSALAAIVAMYKQVTASGGDLRVVAQQARTKRLLAISGVDRVIEVFTSRKDALAAAQRSAAPHAESSSA